MAPEPLVRDVVVGVDGSPSSRLAVDWCVRLARATHATVHVVHVLTYDRELARDVSLDTMGTWRIELDRALRHEWARPLTEAGVTYECQLVEGERPADALLAAMEEVDADLVVVGAHGHRGLARRVLGSTSSRLADRGAVPVVVIPTPATGGT